MTVRKAVQSGNVEDAIEKVNDLNPEVRPPFNPCFACEKDWLATGDGLMAQVCSVHFVWQAQVPAHYVVCGGFVEIQQAKPLKCSDARWKKRLCSPTESQRILLSLLRLSMHSDNKVKPGCAVPLIVLLTEIHWTQSYQVSGFTKTYCRFECLLRISSICADSGHKPSAIFPSPTTTADRVDTEREG